jgi:hypothetical protein
VILEAQLLQVSFETSKFKAVSSRHKEGHSLDMVLLHPECYEQACCRVLSGQVIQPSLLHNPLKDVHCACHACSARSRIRLLAQ